MSRIVKKEGMSPGTATGTASPSPAPSLLPTGGYTDYNLRASAPSSSTGWKHNVMKFNAIGKDTIIDPSSKEFAKPVKLNRKDPRAVRRLTEEEAERVKKAQYGIKDEDGMDVDSKDGVKNEDGTSGTGADGKKPEKEEIDLTLVGKGVSGTTPAVRTKNNMFKKKTKRVFVSSEESRRLKREEWMPWVLRDDEGDNRWIGRLEGGAGEVGGSQAEKDAAAEREKNGTSTKGWRPAAATGEAGGGGSSYVAFVFADNGEDFKVVPINRWYRFSRGPRYATLGAEEAEAEYNRQQKAQEAERWLMHKQPGDTRASSGGPSSSSAASTPRASGPSSNAAIRNRLLDKSVQSGRAATNSDNGGNRKLKSVIKSAGEGGRGRKKERGGEQDDDEFDYEEDFQDDEEGIAKIDDFADEEDTKELEERIKREMRGANRIEGDAVNDDDDDEDDRAELTNTGKEVKKLVKKTNKDGLYDSDNEDDENPYASEVESDDDEASVASLDINDKDSTPRSGTATPNTSRHSRPSSGSNRPRQSNSVAGSRSGSPAPGQSGSAVIARRATSPNPSARRSPSTSRAGSPAPGSGGSGKRKRDESDADAAKRRKNGEGGTADLLTDADLITFLRTGQSFSTKEVLTHFKKALKDPRNKAAIGGLLQSVANLTSGTLVLKPEHRA